MPTAPDLRDERSYRYFDATPLAEYLYDRVADTIRVDLREELDFVDTYESASAGGSSAALTRIGTYRQDASASIPISRGREGR